MTSEFAEIYSRFYLRVKDYDMTGLDEKIVNEMLSGYLRSALSKPMVRRIFKSIAIDEDFGEIEYELRDPLDDDSDKDFVEEVLGMGMVCEWISPKYHSTLLTSQFFGNQEQRWFSQSQHLTELKAMYQKAQIDLRKLIRDHGYNISVMNGVENI